MKVNDIIVRETSTIKAVNGDNVTIDVDGKTIDTTRDALMPGIKPGTVSLKPDAAGNELKPGMTVATDQTTQEDGTDTKTNPGRVSELVRVASSGLTDPATGQFQNVYTPQDVSKATEQLRQLGLNAQGSPLAGTTPKVATPLVNPASKIGATEINESVELSEIKKLSGL